MMYEITMEKAMLYLQTEKFREKLYFKNGKKYERVLDYRWTFGDSTHHSLDFLEQMFFLEN